MARFYLLLSFLLMMTSEAREVAPVIASLGEDIVLPCIDSNMPDLKSCHRVRWIKYDVNDRRVKVILAPHKTKKAQDAGRVKWTPGENGHMSLVLTKLQKSDEGLYGCEIWEGWDCLLVKNISLKVKECKTVQVLKASNGTTVELNCPVDVSAGQKPRDVSWVALRGGNPVPLTSGSVQINGSSLAISSVRDSDSRWYRCEYRLTQRNTQRCFEFNLQVNVKEDFESTVKPSSEGHSGVLTVTAIVAAVITVIVVVAAPIGLFICRGKILQRFAQQPQSCLEDARSLRDYEIVNYKPMDVLEMQGNHLYEPYQQKYLSKERESSSKGNRQNKGEV